MSYLAKPCRYFQAAIVAVIACVLIIACAPTMAAVSPKDLIKNTSKRLDNIADYIAEATVSVDSPSIHIPETKVRIFYKRPDKLHIESKDGVAIIPRSAVMVNEPIEMMLQADRLSIIGSERVNGRDCNVIQAAFDEWSMTNKLWIDKKDWLLMKYEGLFGGPYIGVDIRYKMFEGKYWMPVYIKAKIADSSQKKSANSKQGFDQSLTAIIKVSKYTINKGINDSLFGEKSKGGK